MKCTACGAEVLDIDVRCGACGAVLTSTGSHRMLGATVLGVYELVDVLGQGGMSVVFKGRHKLTNQEVALKLLPPELAAHSQVKSRFIDEAKALAALDHPNIVHLYNFGQENGSFVLAMQYVPGKTWERVIIENKRLGWELSTKICVDVLKALEYAHGRGVVHRDMKPSNVLVRESDGAATVMDFGIAKMTTSTKLTATGQTMGTVRYMSPEQVRGQEVDLRTDIYSLGATLYESLMGDTPFDGETHFEIMTKHLGEIAMPMTQRGLTLPAALEDAVLKSLSKKPDDRFANARDFRLVLEHVLSQAELAHRSTQRVSRDFMRAAAVPTKVSNPIAMAATAAGVALVTVTAATAPSGSVRGTEVAEVTAAAASLHAPSRKRSARTGLVAAGLAVAVLGAGAATYYYALRSPAPPAKPALWQPHEVLITQSADLTDLALESVAASSPEQVAQIIASYRTARSKIMAHLATAYGAASVLVPLRRIVKIPKNSVCEAIVKDAARLSCDDLTQYPFYFRFDDKTLFLAETDKPADMEVMFLTAMVDAIPMGQQNDQAALKLRGELQTFVDSVAPKNTLAPK